MIFEMEELTEKYTTFTKEGCRELELYRKGRCYGTIERYTRSNGTEDVGVRPVPCLTLTSRLRHQVHRLYDLGRYKDLIRMVNDIEATGAINFLAGRETSAAENRAHLFNLKQKAQKQLDLVNALLTNPTDVLPAPTPHAGSAVARLQAGIGRPDTSTTAWRDISSLPSAATT